MELNKICSAILNDLYGGTSGLNANPAISYLQLEDEVVEKRITVLKELYHKNLLKKGDLAISINCIDVDCEDPGKCNNCGMSDFDSSKREKHFEIPLLIDDFGSDSIIYIGSIDHDVPYTVYYSLDSARQHQYKRRGSNKPYVYVNRTPNQNNMHDCWIFNAPFVKKISVIGIFKDLRQLKQFSCCDSDEFLDFGVVSDEVKNRVKQDKLTFYREHKPNPSPTDLIAK